MDSTTIDRLDDEGNVISLLRVIYWEEPTAALLGRLVESAPVAEENALDRGLNTLLGAARRNRDRLGAYGEELAVEFAGLFIGPRQPPAVPFASFYLSETATLMSDVTIDVRKRYLAAGLAVRDLNRLPDDHVAVELEFIDFVVRKCVGAFRAGEREVAAGSFRHLESFFTEHFSRWTPKFAQHVIDAGPGDFYRGAGMMLKELGTRLGPLEAMPARG